MPRPPHANDEYAIREEAADHRAVAQVLQRIEDKAESRAAGDEQPRRAAMQWNLFLGGYAFPWTPGTWPRWLLISAWAIAALWLARLCVQWGTAAPGAGGDMSAFGSVIASVLTGFGALIFGAVCAAVAAIHGLTILTETSAGNNRIEDWPNLGLFLDWFGHVFYVFNAAALSAALACGLDWLLPSSHGAVIGIVEFFLFPFLLLCELEANSAFMPVSRLVFESLWRQGRRWISFYVQSGGLLVAAVVLLVLAAPKVDSRLEIVLGGLVFAAVAMTYFRLLGRLAWHCSIETEDESVPEEGIAKESTAEEKLEKP